MLVLGFSEPNFTGKIAAELERLREHEFVRIVDALVVQKDDAGDITACRSATSARTRRRRWARSPARSSDSATATTTRRSKPDAERAAAMEDGHLIPDEEVWYVADAIPNGSAAAIVLLEHLWAIPLRDAIVDAGGIALADEWIHPSDLVAVGVAAAAD